ncbi:MAG: PQQ-binding-like beta-propeller repeat protein [Verrucomicrobiota bacterium]
MRVLNLLLIAVLCAPTLPLLKAEDSGWPRFRGVNGSGVNDSKPVPVEWEESNRLWSVDIPGLGHGSPVIFGNKLFLLSAVPEELPAEPESVESAKGKKKGKKGKAAAKPISYQWLTLCLNRETGDTLWENRFDQRAFKGHRFNSAASSTPAVDAERVVFAWGTSEQLTVAALSHAGDLLWKTDLGPVVGGHGFGGSPILHGNRVILNNDQEKQSGNLLALDATTGEVAWTVARRSERISYSVPVIYEVEGKELAVFVNWQHGFTAVDPESGEVVAEKSVFYLETNERAISSPIVTKGMVIGTCGFTANPKHCVAMRLVEGEWEEVWRRESRINHIPSTIAVGDYTFLIEDSGIGTCVDTLTGEEKWMERIPGVEGAIFGSPVSDGNNLFFADESGNVHVVSATPAFVPVAMNRLGELCRSTPAIVDGTIFVRTETKLSAFR